MRINCCNLECPKPIIETKKALQDLKNGEILEILLNSEISKENVLKYLKSLALNPNLSKENNNFLISVKKENLSCESLNLEQKRVLFLKSDKIGNGELGANLMKGFLSTLKSLDKMPNLILCVNESVLINTDKTHLAYDAMKELENLGVEIISCGSCLEFFNKSKELKIGKIGNAYEILNTLFSEAKIISL